MRQSRAADRSATLIALLALTIILPTLSLAPFGALWLWQSGWILPWAVAIVVTTLVIHLIFQRLVRMADGGEAQRAPRGADGDAARTRAEKARIAIEAIASRIEPERIDSREAVLSLGIDVVRAVAQEMHPERRDPLWRFTVPDALLITEQVSRRMRAYVLETIPLGNRMTVGQMFTVYRWRRFADVFEQGYNVWRMLRLANPVSAATQEARERRSRQVLELTRDHLMRRLTQRYVREVGRAAIALYGGKDGTTGSAAQSDAPKA